MIYIEPLVTLANSNFLEIKKWFVTNIINSWTYKAEKRLKQSIVDYSKIMII